MGRFGSGFGYIAGPRFSIPTSNPLLRLLIANCFASRLLGCYNEIVCYYVHFLTFDLLTLGKNLHKETEKAKLLLLLLLLLLLF